MSTGIERIAAERVRQITDHHWSAEHDDEHDDGSLAMAAVCYAAPERVYIRRTFARGETFTDPWPWEGWDKRPYDGNVLRAPTAVERIRLLEKAGALIAAEIDRLLRRETQ
jgi:hypothetical protein